MFQHSSNVTHNGSIGSWDKLLWLCVTFHNISHLSTACLLIDHNTSDSTTIIESSTLCHTVVTLGSGCRISFSSISCFLVCFFNDNTSTLSLRSSLLSVKRQLSSVFSTVSFLLCNTSAINSRLAKWISIDLLYAYLWIGRMHQDYLPWLYFLQLIFVWTVTSASTPHAQIHKHDVHQNPRRWLGLWLVGPSAPLHALHGVSCFSASGPYIFARTAGPDTTDNIK